MLHPTPFRLVVAIGRPVPGHRHDSKAWEESGGEGRRRQDHDHRLTAAIWAPAWSSRTAAHPAGTPRSGSRNTIAPTNRSARVEHVFARMKTWKILRDCRLRGDGFHHAMLGIARLHNLLQAA